LVLTNKPYEFTNVESSFSNVITLNYNKPFFSYHDKLIVLEEGLKIKDIVLLIDADNEAKKKKLRINIEKISFNIKFLKNNQ
jgi:hypothetical protein